MLLYRLLKIKVTLKTNNLPFIKMLLLVFLNPNIIKFSYILPFTLPFFKFHLQYSYFVVKS